LEIPQNPPVSHFPQPRRLLVNLTKTGQLTCYENRTF
jgi:hypothetical protein